MNADSLLARLEKVVPRGNGRWLACCPHHKDKSPSLSVTEKPDGRILIHCWAGCPTPDVLETLGMRFSDLMPEKLGEFPGERVPFPAHDVLAALSKEILIARLIAGNMARGKQVSRKDAQRLGQAYARIQSGEQLANGQSRRTRPTRKII